MTAIEKNKPDSLIFDMDGTLWDAVETYTAAWNEYFIMNNMNIHLSKNDLDELMGMEEKLFLEKILPQYPSEERIIMYKKVISIQYKLIDEVGGTMYDGVLNGLKLLARKYKLFIVSNCPEFTIHHFIKWAKIESYITDTMAHGQNYKPKFQNIQFLINKHSLKNPLYIGDTNSDAIQSERANVPFIFMEYGFGKSKDFYRKFDSFHSLLKYYL